VDGKLTVTPGVAQARAKVVALFTGQHETDDRNIAGTAWGFLNAVSAYTDHNQRRRGGAEGRMRALVMAGQAEEVKSDALRYLLAA
jgi:hypothetical protein